MRRHVSLLLANGHPEARFYPLGMVWEECSLVVERMNAEMASHMVLLQLAVAGVLSKDAGKAFKDQISRLTGE